MTGCRIHTQPVQNIARAGALLRNANEEVRAQGIEVARNVGVSRPGWWRLVLLFLHQELDRRTTGEWHHSGQRFIQYDPKAVPVRGGSDCPREGLFGRHIRSGPYCVRLRGGVNLAGRVRDQTEIEQRQPALRVDQNVRWLDVAVNFARVVKRCNCDGELLRGSAKAWLIVAQARGRLGSSARDGRLPAPTVGRRGDGLTRAVLCCGSFIDSCAGRRPLSIWPKHAAHVV